jgi:prephenate dehydrogenase
MQNVAIIGTGLIGASFGLALRKAGFSGSIVGVSSERAIAEAAAAGAIDRAAPLAEAAAKADLVFLSQAIGRILDTLRRLDPMVPRGSTSPAASFWADTRWPAKRDAARPRPMPACFAAEPGS